MYPVFGSAKAQKSPRFGGWFASVEEALAQLDRLLTGREEP
jgi:hypothetical protein